MTTTVSYKVHKTVYRPKEDWQIIPNTQEAIISEETWLRVAVLLRGEKSETQSGAVSLLKVQEQPG